MMEPRRSSNAPPNAPSKDAPSKDASPKAPPRAPSNVALAWTTLLANVVVILQGAVVRATGSGDGCGRSWPDCNGTVLPLGHGLETMIEFSHRLLTTAVLALGIWLVARAWRLRREKPGFLAFALLSFVFLLIEAGLGAATVLFGLTGDTVSTGRGVMVATHMVNSLLFVGALAGAVVYARADAPAWPLRLRGQAPLAVTLGLGLAGMLVLIFTGGIAAMGNTMFPSESLAQGVAADFDPDSHPLVRLRILHPVIAVAVGVYLFLSLGLGRWLKPVPAARRLTRTLFGVYVAQLLVGTVNLALLAPVALQLLHLFLAVAAFGLLSATVLTSLGFPSVREARRPGRAADGSPAPSGLENA